jgi:hypothetical protein
VVVGFNTLAHQLGLYVVLQPIKWRQICRKLRRKYGFPVYKDVAVRLGNGSKLIDAEIASHIVTVEKKKRGADRWFIGGVAGEKTGRLHFRLIFCQRIKRSKQYFTRRRCRNRDDGKPTTYEIEEFEGEIRLKRTVLMKPAGFAISIMGKNGYRLDSKAEQTQLLSRLQTSHLTTLLLLTLSLS